MPARRRRHRGDRQSIDAARGQEARGERIEYDLAEAARRAFDPATWRRAVEARLRMPRIWDAALDPGPDVFGKVRTRRALLIADGDRVATVRPAKTASDALGVVAAVQVSGRGGFTPGTLAVPITRESTKDIDPRTLHLLRWDERQNRYEAVTGAGVNLRGGYVWGRITRPGLYDVVGLPTKPALHQARTIGTRYLAAYTIIVARVFSPTGPWESLGPRNLSCCILDLAIDPSTSDRIYCAASDGGVWRMDSVANYPSTTWAPLTDQQPNLKITCMAVSPADSSVVYYVDSSGHLYRSTDHGDHWTLTSNTNLGSAWRLLAHPTEVNTIYVASDSGFWGSTTGGATWRSNSGQVTLRDGDMSDAAMDPGNPSILYLAEMGTGLLKSIDAGATWQTVLAWSAASSPAGQMIKVALGGQGTDANRTVAVRFDQELFVNRKGGRGPNVPGGGPWTSLGQWGGTGYGDWCHVVAVDPFDDNVILTGAQQLYRTANGGKNWSLVINYYQPHEDQHRVLFDPGQPGVVYAANDGGVFRSTDRGATWQTSGDDVAAKRDLTLGLVTAQFYTAAISGDHAVGNAYHQGMLGASSLAAHEWAGIEGHAWEFNSVYGDSVRPGVFYVFHPSALYRRHFPTGATLQTIGSFPPTAIAVDGRTGSKVLLAATGGTVMRTTDADATPCTWTAMGGISGPTVVSIVFAPARPQQAYALASNGAVYVCPDADASDWTAKTPLPAGAGRALAVSVEDQNVVFAVGDNGVFRSTDGAGTWAPIPGTGPNVLPAGLSLWAIAAGPGALYLMATSGVFTSPDAGQHWFPYNDGLPNVELKELLWTEGDLFVATQGRGLWHHGRYDIIVLPPAGHQGGIRWWIELWLAIHGGDPAPDAIRQIIGRGYKPIGPKFGK